MFLIETVFYRKVSMDDVPNVGAEAQDVNTEIEDNTPVYATVQKKGIHI